MGLTRYEVSLDNQLLTQVSGLSILAVDPYRPPTRTLGSWVISRFDKRKINSAFNTERHIFVECMIQQDSRANLDAQWDNLMGLVQGVEKSLIVPWSISKRQFTVTLNTYTIQESTGSYVHFTLDFICSDNFGYDTAFTSLLVASGRTLYNYTDAITLGGSAVWQVPIIKVTISAVLGATNAGVTIKNPATGTNLTVSRTWAAGDLLVIDSQAKSVTVNGTNVDFSGGIPEWTKGVGYIQYTDGFSTRTMSIFVYQFRRYM